jgi:chemotaxis protein CheD
MRLPAALLSPSRPMVHVLHPGDVACGERDDQLVTLLGSCVAIILTDPRRTVGAMCHVVHARPALRDARESSAYGDVALTALHGLLQQRGINPRLCEAYVFGGGNMFPDLYQQTHVGEQNARWALDALARDGVRVIRSDLGGNIYRRLNWTVGMDEPVVTAVKV